MAENSDPLKAFISENVPEDVFGLRTLLDGFMAAANGGLPEIGGNVDDLLIQPHEGQDLTVDIHIPKGEGPFPILIYLHGGGWILGSPKTHRRLGHRFAEAGYLVFNVHYRLAPEHPFPAAYDDCVQALAWVKANAQRYGGDVGQIVMGGDSAGGNLTAAVASQQADDDVKAVLLIYPALDFGTMDPSMGAIPGVEVDFVDMMVGSYIGHDYDALVTDPRVSPIRSAQNLPATYILCGTEDVLLADCQRLEGLLGDAGVTFESAYYEGMPHGFVQLEEIFPEQTRDGIKGMIDFLDRTLRS